MNLATPPCQHRWRSFIYSRMGMARAQRGIFQGRAAADQTPSALPTVTVSRRSKRPKRSGGSAGSVTSAFLMPFSNTASTTGWHRSVSGGTAWFIRQNGRYSDR